MSTYVPIGFNRIEPESINFGVSTSCYPAASACWFVAPGSQPISMGSPTSNVVTISYPNNGHHIFGRFKESITESGVYKLKGSITGNNDGGPTIEPFKIYALLGTWGLIGSDIPTGEYASIQLTGGIDSISVDMTATVSLSDETKRFGFQLGYGSLPGRQVTYHSLELYSTELIDDPTFFTTTLTTTTNVDLSWVLNNGNKVMIAWAGTDTFGTPLIGTNYPFGSTIVGGGEIIYTGDDTTTTHKIENGSTNYYKIWTWKYGSDTDEYYSSGTTGFIIGNPQSFSGSAISSSQINLIWTGNTNGDDVMLVRSGSTIGVPVDTNQYLVGDTIPGGGEVIYSGDTSLFSDTGLDSNTSYNYKLFSYDSSDNYSTGITISVTTNNSIVDPISFSVDLINSTQSLSEWSSGNTVMLASGLTNNFGNSPYGDYYVGEPIGTGTILLTGNTDISYIDNILQSPPYDIYYKVWSKVGNYYSDGLVDYISVGLPTNIGGFNNGRFYGGYFSGDWYGGKWIGGYFLTGATWNSSDPKPRT